MMAGPQAHRDGGFTLVELLISIVIMGLIASAIGGAFTVYLRTESSTSGRLTTSRYAQTLAQWLPADVQSADTSTISDDPNVPSECSTTPGSTNVIRFRSSEGATAVAYRLSAGELLRVTCPIGGSPSVQVMARGLTSATVRRDQLPVVELAVTVTEGASTQTFATRAVPRRPTTQSTPAPTTTVAPPTSVTTTSLPSSTTTQPPATTTTQPCKVTSGSVSNPPILVSASGNSKNVSPLGSYQLSITTNGSCGTSITFDVTPARGTKPNETVRVTVTGNGSTWTGTITSATSAGNWVRADEYTFTAMSPASGSFTIAGGGT